ncbi:MAG: OmpW family outer membrane protein [Bacteroidota bacterium]|nr:OmpW family outer membrane protein [Bacteroidota bacterium]
MKKIVFTICLAVICLAFTTKSNAQISVGVRGGIAMPLGDIAKDYPTGLGMGMGFGGGVIGKFALNQTISLGLAYDFQSFKSGDIEIASGVAKFNYKWTIMPIVGQIDYYFAKEGFRPYAGLEAGLYMFKFTIPAQDIVYNGVTIGKSQEVSTTDSKIGFAPRVGFNYSLSKALDLNVEAKYTYVLTDKPVYTSLGFNVGILYNLGK